MKRLLVLLLAVLLTGCSTVKDAASNFSADDLMFASMMVPHHEQAVLMSDLALEKSTDPEILALANEIKNAQAPEITEMLSWGASKMGSHAGHMMSGMLSEQELGQLRQASGAAFDQLFLEGMIKHHEGAIEMASEVIDSANSRVSGLAKTIIETQNAEILKMKELLNR